MTPNIMWKNPSKEDEKNLEKISSILIKMRIQLLTNFCALETSECDIIQESLNY